MKNLFTTIFATVVTTAVSVATLATSPASAQTIGQLEVPLDAVRESIRTRETNAGDLVADALLSVASPSANDIVAFINSGSIRGDIFSPGDFTQADLANLLPFNTGNNIVQFPSISASIFEGILENSVSKLPDPSTSGSGRFGQISGFSFTFDSSRPVGQRVIDAMLDNGTQIINNGQVVPGAADISLVTLDFLANGGDEYSFGGESFNLLGITTQQAVANYIQNDLGGVITASDYPEGGLGRIQAVPEPTSVLGLLVVGAIGVGLRGVRKSSLK